MKRIMKDPEPTDFSQWKANDRMAHRPKWKRVPTPIKHKVHESLMQEQGFLCCYCETSVTADESHVEHFRPRRYRDLQLDYDNLLCSCQRELSQGEPRHCGNGKGRWFDGNLLVSPLESDCEDRFQFTANGDIFPRRENDAGAKATIHKLALNIPKLRALREAAVDGLYDLSKTEIGQLLVRGVDGKFLEFHTTIKQVLAS